MPSRYADYSKRGGKDGYEIEHVWADHFERHTDEFDHPSDFAEYRNRIGDLVLLPKSFNASYGDLVYEEKLKHYNGQNLLARSFHRGAYDHNPGFGAFWTTAVFLSGHTTTSSEVISTAVRSCTDCLRSASGTRVESRLMPRRWRQCERAGLDEGLYVRLAACRLSRGRTCLRRLCGGIQGSSHPTNGAR
ncbi:MAG: GmrSD restriction endonuclease domain-containing protein [Solirubrobacteraceae bacterium]